MSAVGDGRHGARRVATALEVRPVRPGEHARVAELTVRAYAEPYGPDILGDYAAELRDVAGHATVAEVLVACAGDTRVVGTATFVPDAANPLAEHDDPEAASLRFLAVDPDAQRAGVGTALLDACLARARGAGATRLRLHVASGNAPAHRFYARHGFARDPDTDWSPVPGFALLGYVIRVP